MKPVSLAEVETYVVQHIGDFHSRRIEKLRELQLETVLARKNPYLFRAKNIVTVSEFVQSILDAYLISQEETLFGDFLEGIAQFVANRVYDGYKPKDLEGIDLLIHKEDRIYVVEIKSGPNWGNSSQRKKMIQNFTLARNALTLRYPTTQIVAVNGCCYGRDNQRNKQNGTYWKLCGQDFWRFLSGDDRLYIDLIQPLSAQAKERNQAFHEEYGKLINQLTISFTARFCTSDYAIDWEKLLKWVSERQTDYPSEID
jgi:hypothetical protein